MASPDSTQQPGKNQVPGQFLGYGLQYTRMLSLLLESQKDEIVSLEVFDDVGVQGGDNVVACQSKSSTSKNPVSNHAEPLWKSLGNWIDAIKVGQLSKTNSIFELYVFGDFEGEICTLFSNANSKSEALSALSKARKILDDGELLPGKISKVLEADSEALTALIMRFRYRHGSGDSGKDLREQLSKSLIPEEFIDNVLTHSLGWVKQQVDSLIQKGQPAVIPVAAFRTEIEGYTRSLVFSECFADLAGAATVEEIRDHRDRRYVRQLDLISTVDHRKLRAISAFLRSSVNRAEWGRLALVHEHSLDDFEEQLIDYWRNSRAQCEISLSSKPPETRGQYLLAECMKCRPALQGRPVPHDFAEGCLHALSDDLTVGWHPSFEKLTVGWK